jgi:HNH endonuclease/AP2 domain
MTELTLEKLKKFLDYDAETGEFRWKIDRGRGVRKGDRAGFMCPTYGYWLLCVCGEQYKAHRVAWFYVYGRWPKAGLDLDHINKNRSDNRIENLREVTRSQNMTNSKNYLTIKQRIQIINKWKGQLKLINKQERLESANLIKKLKITTERLRELLEYDHETGIFTWKLTRNGKAPRKSQAGHISKESGYCLLGIDRRLYRAHQLVWLWETGEWPNSELDHINRNRSDNRFSNLRLATSRQNKVNGPKLSTNTSGFKGVSFNKQRNKWIAQIKVPGKNLALGYFLTPEEAHAVYCEIAKELHGQFARFK